jgi:3'-5' exoribonuclease
VGDRGVADVVGGAQVEREVRLEVGERRLAHALPGGEPAGEVDDRVQRRGRRDRAAHRFRVVQVDLGAARGRDVEARGEEALDHRDSQATPAARDECVARHPPGAGLAFLTVVVNQVTQEPELGPPRSAAQMEADLRDLVGTIQNPHLHALLEAIFGEGTATWEAFRAAPAAKYYHQAYRHGLLEHCLSVAQSVSAIAATFPGIDREVAVCGALLHDIGKLDAYAAVDDAIEMTDIGKLQGEIPLGYFRIRRLIEDLPGFPEDVAGAVLHIILSHHGALAHGSPVVPCTREATLVHMIDNLGGRLGSFDRLEKELPRGSQWSAFDRAIGGGAFFADREAA